MFLDENRAYSPTRQGLRCVQPGTRAEANKGKKGGKCVSPPECADKAFEMTTYKYIVTPFCKPDGVLTSLGRVRLRTECGEGMRTALETAPLAILNIKRTTNQRQAIHDACAAIDKTFLAKDWTDPEALYAIIREIQVKADSNLKLEKSDPAESNDDSDSTESSDVQESNRAFNCHRTLNLVASAEIKRLKSVLPKQKQDQLLTMFESLSSLHSRDGEFLLLLRAFVLTLPSDLDIDQNMKDTWNMFAVKERDKLTGEYVCNLLIEVHRFFCEIDSVLTTIGCNPTTDRDKYSRFRSMTSGTVIGAEMEIYERHNRREKKPLLLKEVLEELTAHFRSRAFIEETNGVTSADNASRGRTPDGSSRARAIQINNVKGKQGAKQVDKSKSKGNSKSKTKATSNYTEEQREAFSAWRKRNPGICMYCEEKADAGHFGNCDRKKSTGELAADNPLRLSKGIQGSSGNGGVFTCRPMTVYRATPSVGQSNTILDTGAAAGSYVSIDKGFDARTAVKVNSLIKGIGGGRARVSKAGTVYIRVPGRVCLANGQFEARRVNIRFDAAYTPSLDDSQTNLIGTSSLVYDGGIVCMKAANVAEFGKQATHTAQGDQLLHLGAVHAIKDRVQRVEIRLTARNGLLYLPSFEYLTQGEIEALEPTPPEALTQLGPMLEDMDHSDSESD